MKRYQESFEEDGAHGHGFRLLADAVLGDGGGVVLDLGCAAGPLAEQVTGLGHRYVGADIDAAAVDQLRARGFEGHVLDLSLARGRAGGCARCRAGRPRPGRRAAVRRRRAPGRRRAAAGVHVPPGPGPPGPAAGGQHPQHHARRRGDQASPRPLGHDRDRAARRHPPPLLQRPGGGCHVRPGGLGGGRRQRRRQRLQRPAVPGRRAGPAARGAPAPDHVARPHGGRSLRRDLPVRAPLRVRPGGDAGRGPRRDRRRRVLPHRRRARHRPRRRPARRVARRRGSPAGGRDRGPGLPRDGRPRPHRRGRRRDRSGGRARRVAGPPGADRPVGLDRDWRDAGRAPHDRALRSFLDERTRLPDGYVETVQQAVDALPGRVVQVRAATASPRERRRRRRSCAPAGGPRPARPGEPCAVRATSCSMRMPCPATCAFPTGCASIPTPPTAPPRCSCSVPSRCAASCGPTTARWWSTRRCPATWPPISWCCRSDLSLSPLLLPEGAGSQLLALRDDVTRVVPERDGLVEQLGAARQQAETLSAPPPGQRRAARPASGTSRAPARPLRRIA